MKRLVILAGLLVAGCSLLPAPPPLTPLGGQVICPPVYKWQRAFKEKLSAEVAALPQGSALNEAVAELVEVREWVAANCKGN